MMIDCREADSLQEEAFHYRNIPGNVEVELRESCVSLVKLLNCEEAQKLLIIRETIQMNVSKGSFRNSANNVIRRYKYQVTATNYLF